MGKKSGSGINFPDPHHTHVRVLTPLSTHLSFRWTLPLNWQNIQTIYYYSKNTRIGSDSECRSGSRKNFKEYRIYADPDPRNWLKGDPKNSSKSSTPASSWWAWPSCGPAWAAGYSPWPAPNQRAGWRPAQPYQHRLAISERVHCCDRPLVCKVTVTTLRTSN